MERYKRVDDRGFDDLIRGLHEWVGSRRALTAVGAGLSMPLIPSAGSVDGVSAKKGNRRQKRKRSRKAKSVDRGVLFFESLAAAMKEATGDCDALAQVAANFKQANLTEFTSLASHEEQLDAATRKATAAKYQARITQATETLHTLMASCRFRGTSSASICEAAGSDSVTPPGAEQCGAGCDCSCICPISGWTCTGLFFGCMGGSEAACCWFGACAGHICDEQCPNCCNCNNSCCGC